LCVFGIGAFKEGGGRGLSYCFLAALLFLWAGFFFIRRMNLRHKTSGFLVFALALSPWVVPAWRVELAVEQYEDHRTTETLRRIEVLDVSDEPLWALQGKPLGIRMRYSVRFPREGAYSQAAILAATDDHFEARRMRAIGAKITPPPENMLADSTSTGTYARYRGQITYAFVVDLVPAFVILSPDQTKSCISFLDAKEKQAVTASNLRTRFSVHIDATDYGGYYGGPPKLTQNAYSLAELYRNAVEKGAKDACVFNSRGEMQ
jgi:hypothetical protein